MQIIAQGKDAVLNHLEEQSRKAAGGKPGEYVLAFDKDGQLYISVAGFTFLGTGFVNFEGKRMVIVNGVVANIQKDT